MADEAIALFTGAARDDLRACPGPGCVLHFVRDSPRREWCSPGCGNRARAARHYARSRDRDHL
ncbi:putative RNA-binding Zn ribbon-like protein [Actinoplanes couchii]|nr:putative RNA-binding Zn ribbon-like protein [Actinoplanes couchii]